MDAETLFYVVEFGIFILIIVVLLFDDEIRASIRKKEEGSVFGLICASAIMTLFAAVPVYPATHLGEWLESEHDARIGKLRVYAENPRKWLCGEIGDSPDIAIDGTLFIIDRKIAELEGASRNEKDGRNLMLYGNAIGALKRERAEVGKFGAKWESCPGVGNGRF